MSPNRKSERCAVKLEKSQAWAAVIPAVASLIGAWAAPHYQPSIAITLILVASAAWAAVCHQARTLVRGRMLRIDLFAATYIVLAVLNPTPWPLLLGVLAGIAGFLLILAWVTTYPKVEEIYGNRFYRLRHPLERLVPLAFLAPKPLTPLFEPAVAMYWSPETLGIPTWRISFFDPPSLHEYISTRAPQLSPYRLDWNAALTRFRRALGLLSLLDTLRRYELQDLDGVALAAAARLAISEFPETALETLRDALMAFSPSKRRFILDAFDLEPSAVC